MDETNSDCYICDFCGDGNFSETEMKTHVLLEHIEHRISCPFCDLCDISEEEMNMHINTAHIDLLEEVNNSPSNKIRKKELEPAVDIDQSLNNSNSLFSDDSPLVEEIKNEEKHATKNVMQESKNCETSAMNSREPVLDITQVNIAPQIPCGVDKFVMDTEYNCPICSFSTDHTDTLTVHVNQAHFQDTPVKVRSLTNSCDANASKHVKDLSDKENCRIFNTRSAQQHEPKSDTASMFECDQVNHSVTAYKAETSSETEFTPVKRDPSCINAVQCPYCDLELEAQVSLQFHINGCHSEEEAIQVDIGDISECPMCGEIFGLGKEEEDNFRIHVENHFISEDKACNRLKAEEKRQENKAKQPENAKADSPASQVLKARQEQATKYQQYKQSKSLQQKTIPPNRKGYKRNAVKNMEKAVARGQMSITEFYTSQQELIEANNAGVDEGKSCTKDVILKLEQYYRQLRYSNVKSHWLASPMDHYAGSYGDRGWGCGYRNLQMLLSCLLRIPVYQPVVFGAKLEIPSIPKLQQMIEEAWARGYDPQGREQLQNVVNTSKWIGATEIYATLSSLKVKCELVDFYIPTGKDNTHPRLFQWVRDYFSSDRPHKPPLYLQHQGHSRTIIGIEEYKDSSLKLLIFDPSTPKAQMMKFCTGNIDNQLMKTIRRTMYGLKAKQYQIVAVSGVLTDREQEMCKLLKSERIP